MPRLELRVCRKSCSLYRCLLAKIFLGDRLLDGKVPASIRPGVTGALRAGGVLFSLWRTRAAPAGGTDAAR